jgi:hypothetical protein
MVRDLTEETLAARVRAVIATEPSLAAMIDHLSARASEVYLYGGTMRDLGLGLTVADMKDFDMVVECDDLDAIADSLSGWGRIERGPFRSIYLYAHAGRRFDVTSVAVFANGIRRSRDMEDLLGLVDASINAVAYDCLHGHVVDPTGGTADIADRVMRALLLERPEKPLLDIYTIPYPAILWFRYQSQALKYNLTIEPATLAWLQAHQHYRAHQPEFETLFWPPRLIDFGAPGRG